MSPEITGGLRGTAVPGSPGQWRSLPDCSSYLSAQSLLRMSVYSSQRTCVRLLAILPFPFATSWREDKRLAMAFQVPGAGFELRSYRKPGTGQHRPLLPKGPSPSHLSLRLLMPSPLPEELLLPLLCVLKSFHPSRHSSNVTCISFQLLHNELPRT